MVGSSSADGSLTLEKVVRPFVAAIVAKRPLLDLALSDRQKRRILESISGDLRKLGDVVSPTLISPLVSVAARGRREQRYRLVPGGLALAEPFRPGPPSLPCRACDHYQCPARDVPARAF